jgi:glycosyltransferase involved in cell wall biosynthesis
MPVAPVIVEVTSKPIVRAAIAAIMVPMRAATSTLLRPVALVMGNYRDEGCGVGSSEPVVADLAPRVVRPLDPTVGSLADFRRRCRRELEGAAGAVVAYPTLQQVERLALVPRLLLLRIALGRRRWLRVHLHEFEKLRRRHRLGVALLVGLLADRVVVSSSREADALHRRYRGWAGRKEVVVVPPANGSAPAELPAPPTSPSTGRVVGIVGQLRPDKGLPWLLDVLARLDARWGRVEVVGRGWDLSTWPEALRSRYELVGRGQVPAAELPALIEAWDLAIAPFEEPPTDGRLSLRTPLAHGVPTLTRGPRPRGLQLEAPHLLFDDEVDVAHLPDLDAAARRAGAAAVAGLEASWRADLNATLYGP